MATSAIVDSVRFSSALTAIADAIRAKTGKSVSLAFPVEFIHEINAINIDSTAETELIQRTITTYSNSQMTEVPETAFKFCTELSSVSLPRATIVHSWAFQSCHALPEVTLPVATVIGKEAFQYCYELLSVFLPGSNICTLEHSTAFNFSPMLVYSYKSSYGTVFVPSSLLTKYKTATNWAYYSNRFSAIEAYTPNT